MTTPADERITPRQLALLEAQGWVEAASLQTADGVRMLLRRGDEERFATLMIKGGAR